MHWKFRAGLREHTGVSLQERFRHHSPGGYPRAYRIQRSRATVKDLHSRLQQAYQKDDVRLVRRTTVVIDRRVHHAPVAVLCERWGLSPACLYAWQQAFLLHGLDSVVSHHGGDDSPS